MARIDVRRRLARLRAAVMRTPASPRLGQRKAGKDAIFDPDFYRRTNADLAHLTDDQATAHWRDFGYFERRLPSLHEALRIARRRGLPLDESYEGELTIDLGAVVIANSASIHAGATTSENTLRWFVHRAKPKDVVRPLLLPPEFLDAIVRARTNHKTGTDRWTRETRDVSSWPASAVAALLNDCPADAFVLESYRYFTGRVPSSREMQEWLSRLDSGEFWRPSLVALLIEAGPFVRSGVPENLTAERAIAAGIAQAMDYLAQRPKPETIELMGIPVMSLTAWENAAARVDTLEPLRQSVNELTSQRVRRDRPRASVLVSLFRSEEFLPAWIRCVESMTEFDQFEFIVISVDPTDRERGLISDFDRRHENVMLRTRDFPFGIYEAWNEGVDLASADYVTNMNVDDIRAPHSLVAQADLLDRYDWVDVVYQDVLLTLRADLNWDEMSAIDAQCRLPVTTLEALISGLNPPHNGPMWRRSLHEEIGQFDSTLRSAADFDFWIRCAKAGKVFFNVPDAHVGYFENPNGLSTSGIGHGVREGRLVLDRHREALVTGSAPEYVEPVDGVLTMPRAHRLTDGFVDEIVRLRLRQGGSSNARPV